MADLSQYQMSVYEDPDTGKVMPQYYLAGAGRKIPVEQQGQLTPQDKVATAFSIGAGSTLAVAVVPMTGYTTLGYNSYANASHAHATTIWASPDGVTKTGSLATVTATNQGRNLIADCSAEYAIIEHTNSDAATKTYDVWARKSNR
jgi:hypothetical protein